MVALAEAAKEQGSRRVRVTLKNALEVDTDVLQLAACLLADVGVDMLVMEDTHGVGDEDSLTDAMEALVYADIEGVPMKARVGLCIPFAAANQAQARHLISLAAGMEVLHFDTCVGVKQAPTLEK